MTEELRRAALGIFQRALAAMDARRAVLEFVSRDGESLRIANAEYDLLQPREVYVIALGKAAVGMAAAIDATLGERITAAIISAPADSPPTLSSVWEVFAGGHPAPNEASLAAGCRALELLDNANHANALVIFLVSGGGSAMMEAPLDSRITLDDLRLANELFVTCGATIGEINFLRRTFSAIKGGRLAQRAALARQVTLIISDVNQDDYSVASSPSITPPEEKYDIATLLREYDLEARLPASIRRVLAAQGSEPKLHSEVTQHAAEADQPHAVLVFSPRKINPRRYCFQLLDHSALAHTAAHHARELGFDVTLAEDLIEQPVESAAAELVRRLAGARRAASAEKPVCLVSTGEFRCRVRGAGIGGRNSETVLRAVIETAKHEALSSFVILSGGTDGIDGNSPAAGAIADETTLERARECRMDAEDYLRRSDSYTFFAKLDDAIMIGATGTNVRDLRLLLA